VNSDVKSEMLKRKISEDIVLSGKKIKTELKLPIELICDIFDLSSFEVKRNFMLVNHAFNRYYQNYIKKLKSPEYVLCTRGRRPEFYDFLNTFVGRKGQKYFRFLDKDQKKIRREMKFDREGIPYCRVPTDGSFHIYVIHRSEKDHVGKDYCDRCKSFAYCDLRRFWWLEPCYLEKCTIDEENHDEIINGRLIHRITYEMHNHYLCDDCFAS
jgi:hypothetical protein